MKICHMTSVHPQEDIRIFHKECISLANAGNEVYLVSQGNRYNKAGVHLYGIPNDKKGRLNRFFLFSKKIYETALSIDADVYHLHDPELLPFGMKLKKHGKKVIFDSHEDVPQQILDKQWIPIFLRKIISKIYKSYESYVVNRIDAVITAVPYVAEKFDKRAKIVININNYPKLDDIQFQEKSFFERQAIVCYAGGVNELRGEKIMINVMKYVNGILLIAGDHKKIEIDGKIKYLGQINREEINNL